MRGHTLDGDRIFTDKERKLVAQSYEHKKEGKLIPISEVKKQNKINIIIESFPNVKD